MKAAEFWTLLICGFSLAHVSAADCPDARRTGEKYVRHHSVKVIGDEGLHEMDDNLAILKAPNGDICFALDTWGMNGHECNVDGKLKKLSSNRLAFDENGECALTFDSDGDELALTASKAWARVGAGGACPKDYCGQLGSVESGKFLRAPK